jgi:hypothetical protein
MKRHCSTAAGAAGQLIMTANSAQATDLIIRP